MSIKKTKSANVQFGKKDQLNDSDFDARNIGHRISIVVPEDVLMAYREQAKKEGTGYQTLINRVLRTQISEKSSLAKRLARLEKAVFKRTGG